VVIEASTICTNKIDLQKLYTFTGFFLSFFTVILFRVFVFNFHSDRITMRYALV